MGHRDGHERHTRELVLEAACEIFARDGYHEATVAKICEAAGANRAAVNYYFGDKESLYREVWKRSFATALEAYPFETPDPASSAEERLRSFMRSLVLRAFDPGPAGRFTRLLAFELTDPQDILKEERLATRTQIQTHFASLMRELLGDGITDDDLTMCRIMVFAPSIGVGIRRFVHHAEHMHSESVKLDPEGTAERMYEFARAGLADLKRSIESRQTSVKGGGE